MKKLKTSAIFNIFIVVLFSLLYSIPLSYSIVNHNIDMCQIYKETNYCNNIRLYDIILDIFPVALLGFSAIAGCYHLARGYYPEDND